MKILVTGANGFIGKNLIAELNNKGYEDILSYTKESSKVDLESMVQSCDFVFHLAGVNRPKDEKEFFEGNVDLTTEIVALLKEYSNEAPVLLTSSIQVENNSPYGRSKREAEEILLKNVKHSRIFRLPNVFGKWSKPNYNTVVATFCHNVARDYPITVSDLEEELELVYIDDVVNEFVHVMEMEDKSSGFYTIPVSHKLTLGKLSETIQGFKDSRESHFVPDMGDALTKKLYSTYLSFLPEDQFSYPLKMNVDNRGSFTEFLKSNDRGQVSVNVSKPGITKGNHWHHTKNEKFLVVSGEGLIRFRKIDSDVITEYRVSGEKLEVVDIPTGYTHSIVNVGEIDLVTVMWANETLDPDHPDTYFVEV
ncbi:polysaccharide biosynthesis C-terminal domain-containing protein [Halobacillus amylolyticus]|uniref:NAD-dependent epimerase/dehydratase family protein n=1 Tax=Halobacillus amylolyticus TaxID=2932259 RepID=A0ABY4H9F6_9BACI|nr:NAD-dependent epimerase/dehydratase family protein [Halobacillus amylolyticus]UOR11312.1 NAD-dependent epimerase/dehydratase family protein [Halobacillus amylolyticus]